MESCFCERAGSLLAEINLNPEAAHCIFKRTEPCFVSGAKEKLLWMQAVEPGKPAWMSGAGRGQALQHPRMNSLPGMLLGPGQAHLLSPCKG